jgi:hypothetical protein
MKNKIFVLDKNNLEYKPVNIKKIVIFFLLTITLTSITTSVFVRKESTISLIERIPIIDFNKKCTLENIKKEISYNKIKHGDIVLAQIVLETGNLSSPIFKENNNLFGMKEAKTRPTTALGINRNHAYYDSWQHSVIDYALWQSAFARNLSEEQYIDYLQKTYAEDTTYKSKIRKQINKIRKNG